LIYLDSSVALAQLLGEGRSPPQALWQEPLVSSRLIEYEIWNRVHARGFGPAFGASARALIGRLRLITLTPPTDPATEPPPRHPMVALDERMQELERDRENR